MYTDCVSQEVSFVCGKFVWGKKYHSSHLQHKPYKIIKKHKQKWFSSLFLYYGVLNVDICFFIEAAN